MYVHSYIHLDARGSDDYATYIFGAIVAPIAIQDELDKIAEYIYMV